MQSSPILVLLILAAPRAAFPQAFNPLVDSYPQSGPGPDEGHSQLPSFALEERYRELSDRSKRLKAEREELVVALEQMEAALEEVQRLEPPLQEAEQALAELKTAALELRAASKNGADGGGLNRLTTRIFAFFEQLESPERLLQGKVNLYSPGRPNATPAQAAVTDLVSAELSTNIRRRHATEAFPAMGRLLSWMEYGADRGRGGPTREELDNLVREIEGTDRARMEAVFKDSKAAADKVLGNLVSRLSQAKSAKDAKLRELHPELARAGESMRLRTEQRESLDKGLVWAIYGMIAALLILFIGLRFFPMDTAGKLIEHRSLVEIISMAFILLTVIILGTGDKLGKETLGTLLGTIAGYIFGQKMGAQARGRES